MHIEKSLQVGSHSWLYGISQCIHISLITDNMKRWHYSLSMHAAIAQQIISQPLHSTSVCAGLLVLFKIKEISPIPKRHWHIFTELYISIWFISYWTTMDTFKYFHIIQFTRMRLRNTFLPSLLVSVPHLEIIGTLPTACQISRAAHQPRTCPLPAVLVGVPEHIVLFLCGIIYIIGLDRGGLIPPGPWLAEKWGLEQPQT